MTKKDFPNLIAYLFALCLLVTKTTGQNEVSKPTPERRYACWGSFGPPVVSAQCPRDTVIQVIRAGLKVQSKAGRCSFSESDCGCEHGELGCNMPDVRHLCMGRPACRMDVTQQYINTDQCRGFSDYMFIEFNCVPVQKNAVSDICTNKVDVSESGFIKSPNYPQSSAYKQTCRCSLIAEGTGSVELTVLDLHSKDCEHNKLQVSTGSGQSNTYCGSSAPKLSPNSGQVTLTYETDGKGHSGGFWLKYEAVPSGPVKIQCHLEMREAITTTEATTPPTTPKPTIDQKRYRAMVEARQKARDAREKAARDQAARQQAAREKAAREKAAREKAAKENAEREAMRKKQEELRRQMVVKKEQEEQLQNSIKNQQDEKDSQNTPWWWRFTMKTKKAPMTVPTTKQPERHRPMRPQQRHTDQQTDPQHLHPVTNHPGKFPDKPANVLPNPVNLKKVKTNSKSAHHNNEKSAPMRRPQRPRTSVYRKLKNPKSIRQPHNKNNHYTFTTAATPTENSIHFGKGTGARNRFNNKFHYPRPTKSGRTVGSRQRIYSQSNYKKGQRNTKGKSVDDDLVTQNANFHHSDKTMAQLPKFKTRYHKMFPTSTARSRRPPLVRVTPTVLAVPLQPTRPGLDISTRSLHPSSHNPSLNTSIIRSSGSTTTQITTHNKSPATDPAHRHSGNGGRAASSNYASNNVGLHGNILGENEIQQKKEPMTVTIIAACVIGSILLIIIIGIVVRFVINRQDPHYAMRQHHKKECVMRHNAKAQRKGF